MRVFGLIGFPLGHSFSKSYFTEKFQNEKIAARYELFPIEYLRDLSSIIKDNPQLEGLNVTIPHKEQIISFLHKIEPEAEKIGAINTIRIERSHENPRLTGYNTDVTGFELSLVPLLKTYHQRALILGTGGASRAVCYVLNKLGIKWQMVSRKPTKEKMLRYSDLTPEIIQSCKLIINTTPVGMYPKTNAFPPLPYDIIGPDHLLYDLVYNPDLTQFMLKGLKHGAQIKNGLEMLKIQADKAWEIWNLK